jgi:hypothetical protein
MIALILFVIAGGLFLRGSYLMNAIGQDDAFGAMLMCAGAIVGTMALVVLALT